jgi:hypothetical protein
MKVRVTFAGRTVEAEVLIASENRRSLALQFDAILGGLLRGHDARGAGRGRRVS